MLGLVCSENVEFYRNPFGETLVHFQTGILNEEQVQVLPNYPALQERH